jgi:SAM-dependent methyltransferase
VASNTRYVQKLKRVVPRGLHPSLGALRRWTRALSLRTRRQKRRLLDDPSLSAADRELLAKVSGRIHYGDGMYVGDGGHYYKVGLSALRCIDEALALAKTSDPEAILDLPCGYGRVLRFLTHRFPEAKITACELDRDAVDFCVTALGASPAYSSTDLDRLSLGIYFDLIWCGSLITHIDDAKIVALFEFFGRHLAPGGLLIFTTHGDYVAGKMGPADFDYGLLYEQIQSIVDRYSQSGFAYTDYPDREHYGISLTSPEWIRKQIEQVGGLRPIYFRARGWDNHQDVFGFVREGHRPDPAFV